MSIIDFIRMVPRKRSIKYGKRRGILFSNPAIVWHYVFYISSAIFILSIGYILYIVSPALGVSIKYTATKGNKQQTEGESIKSTEILKSEINKKIYRLIIPKIGANTEIVLGISPYNTFDYESVLRENKVAQASMSDEPGSGKGKSTYIFAHSTSQGLKMARNNVIFYLLGKLEINDPIYITNGENTYSYSVRNKKIVEAKEVEYLTYREEDRELLFLQTCWPLGTNWKRLIVVAERGDT